MQFVTGGTGLIGSHLLFQLVSAGKKVKALKRETSNLQQVQKVFSYYTENAEELYRQIEWVDGDILDYFGLEKLLSGVSEVFHCAAIVSFCTGEREQMIRNNVEGTANLVNAALENGVKKFCHVSSVAALGNAENGFSIDELTNWVPSKKNSGYSESKFYSETEVWRGIEEGLDAVIVNPSIVLGPGNWDSGSAQLFKTVWNGMKFYTKGVTGYVDVNDVVRAMILLMGDASFETCKNQRFLLNAENLSYKQVFTQIADAFGKTRPKFYASPVLLAFAWRAAAFWGMISGKSPAVTRETASASASIKNFDGSKITRCFEFDYIPVFQSIQQTANFFLNELPN
jgi:nucleoside-diphosphate-sugar epimerase